MELTLLPWDCSTRVDQVSRELLAKMADANCQLVSFGVESGSQKMLDAMKKGTTVKQNERAIRWSKEVGISVAVSVIFGYPNETMDMLEQTLDFIRRTEPDYVYACIAVPYPGTELHDLLKDLKWEMSTNWNNYHEETQVFNNTLLPLEKIREIKRKLYNNFFSPSYFLNKSLKRDVYSQTMARTALNHFLWRIKLPRWVSASFKKLMPQKNRGGHNAPSKDKMN